MINSPEWFNLVHSSSDVTYSGLNITASSTKGTKIANTDGWDIYRSDNIVIRDSIINNQDDCVSFKPSGCIIYYSTNFLLFNICKYRYDECSSVKPYLYRITVSPSLVWIQNTHGSVYNRLLVAYQLVLSDNTPVYSILSRTSLLRKLTTTQGLKAELIYDIVYRNVRLIDTQNGARIKAFAGPGVGSGIVKNVTFENFAETSVDNPLVIDQVSKL